MLIDKGLTPGEVVTIKLTSGEELIAKLVEENSRGYKVSKPLVLSMSQQGMGMMPYLFTANPEKEITLHASAVCAITNSDKQFADQYIQGTTGIRLA
jgi:hypothetical protein